MCYGLPGDGVRLPTLLQLSKSLPSNDAISNWPPTELMLGLNMPERRDGDSAAVSLHAPRCRLEGCGDRNTGDGERKPGEPNAWMSENGDSGDITRSGRGDALDTSVLVGEPMAEAMPGTATKGESARDSAGELPSSVGLRATSKRSDPGICGVPYLTLGARPAGPTTAGVNELAVDPERVELAGLLARDDVTALGTAGLGDTDSAVTDDCNLEVLIAVLGMGLCITGVDAWDRPNLGAKGDDGAEDSVADSGTGDIGS